MCNINNDKWLMWINDINNDKWINNDNDNNDVINDNNIIMIMISNELINW